jgi:hypothetical protein
LGSDEMTTRRPVEVISSLVGGIYDCALNPANWEAALAAVCLEFSFANSILGVVALRAGTRRGYRHRPSSIRNF